MTPTGILVREHEVIKLVLDCLEHLTVSSLKNEAPDSTLLMKAVDFFRGYADACHHAKEEDNLFPLLMDRHREQFAVPVECMLEEHRTARKLVATMDQTVRLLDGGDRETAAEFAITAGGYIRFLRSHIQKEDYILFPLVEQLISDEDRTTLLNRFTLHDNDQHNQYAYESFMDSARSMARACGQPHEVTIVDWHVPGH